MTLDPELVALTRRLRPFRRRLWFRRIVRDSVRIGAVVAVVLLALAIVARIIPFEWLAVAAIAAVAIGLVAIAVDAVRVRPTLAEAALAIDTRGRPRRPRFHRPGTGQVLTRTGRGSRS